MSTIVVWDGVISGERMAAVEYFSGSCFMQHTT